MQDVQLQRTESALRLRVRVKDGCLPTAGSLAGHLESLDAQGEIRSMLEQCHAVDLATGAIVPATGAIMPATGALTPMTK
jgi:hypothetical protein